jgi:hypothetical protein
MVAFDRRRIVAGHNTVVDLFGSLGGSLERSELVGVN